MISLKALKAFARLDALEKVTFILYPVRQGHHCCNYLSCQFTVDGVLVPLGARVRSAGCLRRDPDAVLLLELIRGALPLEVELRSPPYFMFPTVVRLGTEKARDKLRGSLSPQLRVSGSCKRTIQRLPTTAGGKDTLVPG